MLFSIISIVFILHYNIRNKYDTVNYICQISFSNRNTCIYSPRFRYHTPIINIKLTNYSNIVKFTTFFMTCLMLFKDTSNQISNIDVMNRTPLGNVLNVFTVGNIDVQSQADEHFGIVMRPINFHQATLRVTVHKNITLHIQNIQRVLSTE